MVPFEYFWKIIPLNIVYETEVSIKFLVGFLALDRQRWSNFQASIVLERTINLEITRLIKLMLKYLGFLLICLLGWLEVGLDTPSVSWLGYWADAPSVSWLGSWADSSVFWVSSKSKCLGRSELKFSIALITSFSCHAGKRPRHLIKLSLSSLWQSNRSS